MSKKCRAYSESRLGLAPTDNRRAFYAGWDAALRERLAQPEQEPVAWRTKNAAPPGGYVVFQQYPQAVADLDGEIEPLYTTPQPRQWQGLTDDEIALIVAECASSAHRHDDFSFARAIEAKLREKGI